MTRRVVSLRAPTCRGVAISAGKFQKPNANLQINPCKMQTVKMKMQNDRAKVKNLPFELLFLFLTFNF